MIPLNSLDATKAYFFKEALISLSGHNFFSRVRDDTAIRRVEEALSKHLEPDSMEIRELYARMENFAEAVLIAAISESKLGRDPEFVLQRIEQNLRPMFPNELRLGELVRKVYAYAQT